MGVEDFSFWTDDRMAEFWSYVGWLLGEANIGIMLVFAIFVVGLIAKIVVSIFKKDKDKNNESDYELRNY